MNKKRAVELQSRAKQVWDAAAEGAIEDIFINLGKFYLPVLNSIVLPEFTKLASGGIGVRNGQLKEWLRGRK